MELINAKELVLLCIVGGFMSISADGKDYDYIIVGGGVAGSVLAARLSEDKHNKVLVLEAGGELTDPFIRFTKLFLSVSTNPELGWGYVTEPQKQLSNTTVYLAQGKLLGGSGSHNTAVYSRGSPHDYNRWAEMGNQNWSYNELLPYFKKSEMMHNSDLAANGYHGIDGVMKTRVIERSPLVDELIKAGVEIGFKDLEDYNGVELEGIDRLQMNVDEKGERSSTYEAFLKPVRCRRNLDVTVNALVIKVSFNMGGKKPKANGVFFIKDNQTHFIKAKKEVIICSGAIGSPAILMRSGIGPREHLESLGIEVISDLPVGNNLQDHISLGVPFDLSPNSSVEIKQLFTFEELFDLIFIGKGLLSEEESIIAVNKTRTQPSTDLFPYLEFLIGRNVLFLPEEVNENVRKGMKITNDMVQTLINSTKSPIQLVCFFIYLHPRNTGTVRLHSTDPMLNPKIDYQFFTNHKDIMDIIEGIRTCQRLISTNVMQNAEAQPNTIHDPNCQSHVFDSDSYWECYMKTNFLPGNHLSCTCKMAPDDTGVVDDALRVKGVKRLRVADASIMPFVISGHTGAPTAMIAEKAADLIQE